MTTSSILKNFVITGDEQVKSFFDALEKSYRASLKKEKKSNPNVRYIDDPVEAKKLIKQAACLNEK